MVAALIYAGKQVVLLHAMASPSKPLRQTGGTSVAVIVGVGGLQNWPELIRALTSSLESNDKNSLEGSLDALFKVSTYRQSVCNGSHLGILKHTKYEQVEQLVDRRIASSNSSYRTQNCLKLPKTYNVI